jgi:hypothetical protein
MGKKFIFFRAMRVAPEQRAEVGRSRRRQMKLIVIAAMIAELGTPATAGDFPISQQQWQSMLSDALKRGGTSHRDCLPKEGYCATVVTTSDADNSGASTHLLSIEYFGKNEPVRVFCKLNSSLDRKECQCLEDGVRTVQVMDTKSGEWVMTGVG